MHALVARRGRVALAVGDVFQDGRDGVLLGILRQPDAGSQTASVRQSDEGILNFGDLPKRPGLQRSEEHTSELQSLMRISYAVFCLKKKNQKKKYTTTPN